MSADDIATIRAALLAALHYTGGDLEEEPIERESEALAVVLEHEAQVRAAIRIIDQAVADIGHPAG